MSRVILVLLLLAGIASVLVAQSGLKIQIGNRTRQVDARNHDGQTLYQLRGLSQILGLNYQESGNRLTLTGNRGALQLTDGRRLVGFADQFILISGAPWKRRDRDWYVPEDFLTKALPHILASRLEPIGDRVYRLDALESNRVEVRVTNYPDHVTLVFTPSNAVPIQVHELTDSIRVEFQDLLVQPQLPEVNPDPNLVAGLDFNSRDIYGSFRIRKGSGYHSYREFTLTNPLRKVIDIYAPPVTAGAAARLDPTPPSLEVSPPAPVTGADPADEVQLPVAPTRPRFEVVLDAGHGGPDLGLQASPLEESRLSMAIATLVGHQLRQSGLSTGQTRTQDIALSLDRRSALANYHRSRVFVSIHAGGSPLAETRGPIVYVHQPGVLPEVQSVGRLTRWEDGQLNYLHRSRELANSIQVELNSLFQTENQVVEVPLALLAPITAPAVLVEVGFLTNPQDRQQLTIPEFQKSLADAIAGAVSRFLQ